VQYVEILRKMGLPVRRWPRPEWVERLQGIDSRVLLWWNERIPAWHVMMKTTRGTYRTSFIMRTDDQVASLAPKVLQIAKWAARRNVEPMLLVDERGCFKGIFEDYAAFAESQRRSRQEDMERRKYEATDRWIGRILKNKRGEPTRILKRLWQKMGAL